MTSCAPSSGETAQIIADTMESLQEVAIPADDVAAIVKAALSFRVGAPIQIDDIRFAAAVDGHPIDAISPRLIPHVLRRICDPVAERKGGHGAYWYRRTP